MRFRVTISDPWELTSADGPTCLVGEGIPNDQGFTLQLDPGAVLGGVAVIQAHVKVRHVGASFSQMEAGERPPVNGTAVGPNGEVRFIGGITPE